MIYRCTLWAIALASVLALTPSPAAAQSADSTTLPSPVEELVREVRTHEKARRWEEAIHAWFRVVNFDRGNVEARESIPKVVRLALQSHRHRDPAFQARVLAMSPADVLTLYDEVLIKVQEHYIDSHRVTTARLFRQGIDEFLAALIDPYFVDRHLKGVDESAITRFRAHVQKAWSEREILTNRQAMAVVAEIAAAAKRLLGIQTINPVVGEFICGACNSLDEYSAYLSASQYAVESSGSMQMSVHIRLEEGDVAYLRITHFQPTTPQEVENALKSLAGTVRALVLDLRGNTGGIFPAAVKTAEKFLPGGIIVTAQGQHESANKVYTSTAGNAATDLPMIVLVDGQTASAAEVLAVALRDNRRAKLIGTATFGKGTVQKVVTFTTAEEIDTATGKPRPRAAIRITQARLIAPSGGPISGVGVTPDQLIPDRERQFAAALEQAKELARRYMGMPMMNGIGMRMGD